MTDKLFSLQSLSPVSYTHLRLRENIDVEIREAEKASFSLPENSYGQTVSYTHLQNAR